MLVRIVNGRVHNAGKTGVDGTDAGRATMADQTSTAPDFDALYSAEVSEQAPIPWDIGGPQPVVQQLVAYGALRGEVLDPGTGPGYHAIHYASRGYATTGVDGSPAAIEWARRNAQEAGVDVDFQVADATELDGLEGRFDTVVDSAFYHVFVDEAETQIRYVQALHRASKPGARLFMFEFGCHNVNGIQWGFLGAENFERVLGAGGWHLDYLGTSTYQARFGPETLAKMARVSHTDSAWMDRTKLMQEQLAVIGPLLKDHLVHIPIWVVAATRVD
jgi:SAM-dependent methyltransferase